MRQKQILHMNDSLIRHFVFVLFSVEKDDLTGEKDGLTGSDIYLVLSRKETNGSNGSGMIEELQGGLGWHGLAWAGMGWHGLAWAGMGWHGLAGSSKDGDPVTGLLVIDGAPQECTFLNKLTCGNFYRGLLFTTFRQDWHCCSLWQGRLVILWVAQH